jgi:hypothetical protein
MTLALVLLLVIAVAALAPGYGADSRGLTDRGGGPPDLLPDDGDRHPSGADRSRPRR